MYDYTGNNWSHWISNRRFKERFGSLSRRPFDRFTTKDSCTWNSTHYMESAAVWNWKTEWWGWALVEGEKRGGGKGCDRKHIIIIIITIIIQSVLLNVQA
jgi:hypothetical protein